MTVHLENFTTAIQSAIDDLATLDFIPANDKANVLMVLSGNKPSMHTGLFSDFAAVGKDLPKNHSNNKATFSKIVADLGLKCKIQLKQLKKEVDGTPSYCEWAVFCVAKEMNVAVKLFDARESCNEREEGILLGFPQTAVDAFVNGTMIDIEAVPQSTEYVTVEEMKLLNHRLSNKHWEEEIKYLPNFARSVKQISPEIYEQCQAEG